LASATETRQAAVASRSSMPSLNATGMLWRARGFRNVSPIEKELLRSFLSNRGEN
jgi:hypothetical protein